MKKKEYYKLCEKKKEEDNKRFEEEWGLTTWQLFALCSRCGHHWFKMKWNKLQYVKIVMFCINLYLRFLWLFAGLSARDLILQFRHKVLLLFKLLLLEKKVVFFQSPVHPLCTTILTLLSLHPGMIENGLKHSTHVRYDTVKEISIN